MAGTVNVDKFVMYQGATFVRTYTTTFSIAGWTLAAQARKDFEAEDPIVDLSAVVIDDMAFEVRLTATQTGAIGETDFRYDVVGISPAGVTVRLVNATVDNDRRCTR